MTAPPPPGSPPPPTGGPGYWPPPDHPDAMMVLILGILSVAMCPLLGPFAWAKGSSALGEIAASRGSLGGESSVNAGRICGIIGTVFLILIIAYILFILILLGGILTRT